MVIVFLNRDYETNEDADMVRLQAALDRWDISRRVADKRKAVLVSKTPGFAGDPPMNPGDRVC